MTKDGSRPTKENSIPFCPSNEANGGRGSIVWFTQASMLQSGELPTDTVSQAKELNKKAKRRGAALIDTAYDAQKALENGMFTFNATPSSSAS